MTKPSSITHHSGSGQSRLYLKHLFSVPFEVALPPTVKKDIVSFDSNMQYYSEFVDIHRFRVLQSRGLIAITRRGLGSLAASVFSNDANFTRDMVLGIGDLHGRVLVVDSTVGNQHTGHGNVVPSCLHGGPGRAGGGERSLPACVRCCSITAVLSCRDQSIASGNCRDCALTVHSYIHNHHLLLQALRLVPLGRNL